MAETDRVVNLPHVDPDLGSVDLTDEFARPGGEWTLNPIQSLALDQARKYDGLIGSIAVGGGKTLLSCLLPCAMGAERPLLLVPGSRTEELGREALEYNEHFEIATNLNVLSYAKFSRSDGEDLLLEYEPDLIIADEVHKLRDCSSTRTMRLLRYYRNRPETMFVGMSGTLTARSIEDYFHLLELALRENTPLPRSYNTRQKWARAIDRSDDTWPNRDDFKAVQPLVDRFGDGEQLAGMPASVAKDVARDAYFDRFKSAPGVVYTTNSSCDASINLYQYEAPKPPAEIREAANELADTWTLPDGSYAHLQTAMHVAVAVRRMLCGFYYTWDWPDGEVDWGWMQARKDYHRALRDYRRQSISGRDSRYLIEQALVAGDIDTSTRLWQCWEEWKKHSHKPKPPVRTVWVDEYLLDHAMALAEEHDGILWYQSKAVAAKLQEKGFEVFWPGGRDPSAVQEARPIALSVDSQGTGANLQPWNDQVVFEPIPNGQSWEQLLGRTHREGQRADSITARVYAHCSEFRECMDKAERDARYIQRTQGQAQKLLLADWSGRK